MTCALMLASVWWFANQNPGSAPKPDRSAEPRLKEVFARMGRLASGRVRIQFVSREDSSQPYYPEAVLDFWWRPDAKFRAVLTGSWGNTVAYVSDGKTLMVDPMDLASGVTLKNAKDPVYEADENLAQRGGASSPLFYFLAGPKGFDELVAKDGEVVTCPGEPGEEAIRFKSTKLGTMRVYFDPKDRNLAVGRIDFDNLEYRKDLAERLAEWGVDAPTDPLDVHTIKYLQLGGTLRKDLFDPVPPKGLSVHDERKKPEDSGRALGRA